MKTITLTLTIDEANLVLNGLGRLPFAKVLTLVGKIQRQARAQNGDGAHGAAPAPRPPAPILPASGGGVDHVE